MTGTGWILRKPPLPACSNNGLKANTTPTGQCPVRAKMAGPEHWATASPGPSGTHVPQSCLSQVIGGKGETEVSESFHETSYNSPRLLDSHLRDAWAQPIKQEAGPGLDSVQGLLLPLPTLGSTLQSSQSVSRKPTAMAKGEYLGCPFKALSNHIS